MIKTILLALGLLLPNYSQATETITLNPKNTVTLRGPVTSQSMTALKLDILNLYYGLFKPDTIYLVMDTPGGEVISGDQFIDFANSLDVDIKTITLFSASMGYHIVQNLDERLVMDSSILMSHRASLSMSGELHGEFNKKLEFITNIVDRLDTQISDRMEMDLNAYRYLIRDEFWVSGQGAINYRAADRKVKVVCSKKLDGTDFKTINTIFGPIEVEIHRCPLITTPVSVDYKDVSNEKVKEAFNLWFTNRVSFVNKYITNPENFHEFKTWLSIGY